MNPGIIPELFNKPGGYTSGNQLPRTDSYLLCNPGALMY